MFIFIVAVKSTKNQIFSIFIIVRSIYFIFNQKSIYCSKHVKNIYYIIKNLSRRFSRKLFIQKFIKPCVTMRDNFLHCLVVTLIMVV